jgi:hypothetical protein
MNSENKTCCGCTTKCAYAVAILGAIFIVVFLNRQLKHHLQAPAIEVNRAEERSKALAEIRQTEQKSLDETGYIDATKGIVRLKIEDAMALTESKWKKDPAAARTDLLARVEKANPPPPPPPPPKKSEFE